MKTRTSTLKNLTRQYRNNKKSTKAAGTKQRTSFTPGMENLETRALLTTMPGLTLEPTADATTQVATHIENQDTLVNDLRVTSAFDKSSTKIAESVCKGKVFPQVERIVPNEHSNAASYFHMQPANTPNSSSTDTGALEEIAKGQQNDAAYIKFDGIMSGTDTGALEEIAKSQKNDAAYIKFDGIMAGTDTSDMEAIAKSQKNDAAYIKFDGIMAGTDTSDMEEIAKSQKNDAAYIKFDGIMAGTDTSDMEEIAKSQKNDAAYIKFDGIMQAPGRTMPAHHAAVDQLFTQEGLNEFFNPATFR